MLFCNSEGLPITEHLPEGHEGREIYGIVEDPHPDKGRAFARLEKIQGRRIEKEREDDDDEESPKSQST